MTKAMIRIALMIVSYWLSAIALIWYAVAHFGWSAILMVPFLFLAHGLLPRFYIIVNSISLKKGL